jgi:putative transposase
MGQVIQIDEARIRDHLSEIVRGTVEETLNALLDAEADRLCGAGRYGGEVNLRAPKLRRKTFETAIIERYRRRENSVEEDVSGGDISVRRVENITEALWGQGQIFRKTTGAGAQRYPYRS